jgi:hypothetical protein
MQTTFFRTAPARRWLVFHVLPFARCLR